MVVKANGQTEPFSGEKILRSLNRAHVPKQYQHEIVQELEENLGNRVSSQDIYDHIRKYFNQKHLPLFAKYNLKIALMQLGPSGYPFERYIGALLRHYGYTTIVSQIVKGKCVAHEVDVIAQKGLKRYIIECKFHNQPGTRSDIKTALYVKARVDDIIDRVKLSEAERFVPENYEGWLVTNTKCTSDAIQYALCAGITIIGWNYPEHGNLQDMVEEAGLYPITALTTLSQGHKESLLQQNVVLAKELLERPEILQELHLPLEDIQVVQNEVKALFLNEEEHDH